MFKYFLIVLIFWCENRGYDVYAQTDTSLTLPASSQNPDKQNKETSKQLPITMNGHTNYNVGQQIFYIYDSQFFKRLLLDNKDNSFATSHSTSTHRFYPYKLTWNKARQTCIQEGGHLAIINSDFEEKILSRILQEKNADRVWLGLHDLYEEGDWVTITDVPIENIGYAKWTARRTNVSDNMGDKRNCAILIKEEGMNDVECNNMYYFFCEIST